MHDIFNYGQYTFVVLGNTIFLFLEANSQCIWVNIAAMITESCSFEKYTSPLMLNI